MTSPDIEAEQRPRARPEAMPVVVDDVLDAAPRSRVRWWRELAIVAVSYGLYTVVRDMNGERPASIARAYGNARHIISLERHLGLWHEAAFQRAFIHHRLFMEFWDGYYGTIHFLAVVGVLVVLFARTPARYRRWRNTLALTTLIALGGFAVFPLMPPRLLPHTYGFVDSLQTIGGVWDFREGAVDELSNQYAAMPSLHTAWALWCAVALWPMVRRARLRPLLLAYPLATIFCILVTANHYVADEVGGVAILAVGYGVARAIEAAGRRWRRGHGLPEAVAASA